MVVIAGQSNAKGAGKGQYHPEWLENDDRIYQIGRFGTDDMKVIPMNSPTYPKDVLQGWSFDPRYNKAIGFGPSFARRLAINIPPNRKVLLVPAAKGSTSIRWWDTYINKEDPSDANSVLFDDMVNRTRAALYQAGSNTLQAFLWHQGESDIVSASSTGGSHVFMPNEMVYKSLLKSVLLQFRQRFANFGLFPILIGQPANSFLRGDSAGLTMKARFVSVMQNTAREIPLSAFVSSEGLLSNAEAGTDDTCGTITDCKRDITHFSGQSQVDYGKRYYESFEAKLRLLKDY